MTHTDDLFITGLLAGANTGGYRNGYQDGYDKGKADERAAVHADIAARALSDEVVEAVHQAFLDGLTARHLNESGAFHSILIGEAVAETIPALLTALGITESEVEE